MVVAICLLHLCQLKMWSLYCCKDRHLSIQIWTELIMQTLVTVLPVIILNLRKSRAAHHEKSIIYDYYSNQSDIVHFTIYLSIIICLCQWYKFIISLKLKDFFFKLCGRSKCWEHWDYLFMDFGPILLLFLTLDNSRTTWMMKKIT